MKDLLRELSVYANSITLPYHESQEVEIRTRIDEIINQLDDSVVSDEKFYDLISTLVFKFDYYEKTKNLSNDDMIFKDRRLYILLKLKERNLLNNSTVAKVHREIKNMFAFQKFLSFLDKETKTNILFDLLRDSDEYFTSHKTMYMFLNENEMIKLEMIISDEYDTDIIDNVTNMNIIEYASKIVSFYDSDIINKKGYNISLERFYTTLKIVKRGSFKFYNIDYSNLDEKNIYKIKIKNNLTNKIKIGTKKCYFAKLTQNNKFFDRNFLIRNFVSDDECVFYFDFNIQQLDILEFRLNNETQKDKCIVLNRTKDYIEIYFCNSYEHAKKIREKLIKP